MNHLRFLLRAALGVLTLLAVTLQGGTADPPAAKIDLDELVPHPDLEWLRRAKVPTDDAGLAKYLNGLRGTEADPAEVERLVGQLQTGSKAEQDAAAASARVRSCLEKIEEAGDKPLARPAMRRLVMRWATAPGTAEALLGYLPFAFDPDAELDAWYGLDELAAKDSKVLAVLAGALADKQPARRAVAACILGRRGDAVQKKAVAGLLKDADPLVRLRAAQGLLAGKDTAGVPTLIDLLTDAAVEVRWQAEELLRRLAVDTAPKSVVGAGKPKTCEACQAAWRKWWQDQGEKADVSAAEREPRRPLLLLAYDRKAGRAWIVGCDGITRHEWKGLDRLADAQYVPGGSVLSLHEQPVREKPLLAELDFTGKPLWQYDDMRDPQYFQRLGNGHVFVAERQDVVVPYLWWQVVAAGGRQMATRPEKCSAQAYDHAFRMTDDGRVAGSWLYSPPPSGTRFNGLTEYDPTTDTTRKLHASGHLIGGKPYLESNLDGGYLLSGLAIPAPGKDRMMEIHEYDWDGDKYWKYKAAGLVHATRLRGGSTIGCADRRLIEISADRRQVGEIPMTPSPAVARSCLGLVRFGFDTFPADTNLETDIDYRIRCLKMKDPKARLFALGHLAEFRWMAARAIPQLQAHGEDPDPEVRKAMREALIAIGIDEIPKLIAEAKDSDPARRATAVNRLGGYRNGPGVLAALLKAVEDDNPKVRSAALRAFDSREPSSQAGPFDVGLPGSYRGAAEQIIPALQKALKDPDDTVRTDAIIALRVMGPKAKTGIPALVGILKYDSAFACRATAAISLGKIDDGSPEVASALYSALKDSKHPNLRRAAADGLRSLRPVPKDVVERLIETYKMTDVKDPREAADIRSACLYTLFEVSANDMKSLEFLKQVMSEDAEPEANRFAVARYLFSLDAERDATFHYFVQWSGRETDVSVQLHVREQTRLFKVELNKQQYRH